MPEWDNDNRLKVKELKITNGTFPVTITSNSQTAAYNLAVPTLTSDMVFQVTPYSTALGQVITLPMFSARNNDLTGVDATGGSGKFALGGTVGTALYLRGEAAQNNTKTDQVLFEMAVPSEYRPGNNLTLDVSLRRIVSAGTTLTTSIDCEAWIVDSTGAVTGAGDICATNAQAFTNTTTGDKVFTLTGTTLNAGARLLIRLTGVATEAGNTGTVAAQIDSVVIS